MDAQTDILQQRAMYSTVH